MDLEKILTDLKHERDRISQAIILLSGDSAAPARTARKRGNAGQEARRHHACWQEAPVFGDEETLGRAPQKIVLDLPHSCSRPQNCSAKPLGTSRLIRNKKFILSG